MVVVCGTEEEFKKQLTDAGDKLVVVDFYADWCGPCRMIGPKFNDMAETDFKDKIVALKVDVDANGDLAQEYGVRAMPTFIFIKKGEKVTELVGANPDKLKSLIEENL